MIDQLKQQLPRPTLKKKKVVARQDVPEIMNEVVKAHKDYRPDYDKIASFFWKGSVSSTVKFLFDFCKSNMRYLAETDRSQTVRSPAAILETATAWGVDCKHYAGFIGGVLDALKRQGHEIVWRYRFVSYTPNDPIPEHVFIVVTEQGKNIYVDPVLEKLDQRFPKYYYFQEKLPMLSRVNGIEKALVSDGSGGMYYTNTKTNISPTGNSPVYMTTTEAGPGVTTVYPPDKRSQAVDSAILFVKENWLTIALGVFAVYYLSKKK